MNKSWMIIALLVAAIFVLSACKPATVENVDEGSYSVVGDDAQATDANNAEDVFNELDNAGTEETNATAEENLDEDLNTVDDTDTSEVTENTDVTEDSEDTTEVTDKDVTETVDTSKVYDHKYTVKEGELVKVKLSAKDPDGDALTYSYQSPLNDNGEWQTKKGDAGKYYTRVIVSDGRNQVPATFLIEVLSVNEAPVLTLMNNIAVSEGDTVKLNPKATDADGDKLTFKYSGWMTTDTKETTYKDAGTYKVTVTVSDGNGGQDSQTITVTVKDVNRAPVLESC